MSKFSKVLQKCTNSFSRWKIWQWILRCRHAPSVKSWTTSSCSINSFRKEKYGISEDSLPAFATSLTEGGLSTVYHLAKVLASDKVTQASLREGGGKNRTNKVIIASNFDNRGKISHVMKWQRFLTEGAWRQGSFLCYVKHRANVPVDTSFFIRNLISVFSKKLTWHKLEMVL